MLLKQYGVVLRLLLFFFFFFFFFFFALLLSFGLDETNLRFTNPNISKQKKKDYRVQMIDISKNSPNLIEYQKSWTSV